VVQHSFPIGFREELPNQPINIEETAYSATSVLFEKTQKRCGDTAAKEDLIDHPMQYEPKTEVSL
jgi:hypothetical protein